MKWMKKYLSIIIAVIMCISSLIVHAMDAYADIFHNRVDLTYEINGYAPGTTNKTVTISVTDADGNPVHVSYVYTDLNKNFNYKFVLSDGLASGMYYLKYYTGGQGAPVTLEISFINTDDEANFLSMLRLAQNADDISSLLETNVGGYSYRAVLGLNKINSFSLSDAGLAFLNSALAAYGTFNDMNSFYSTYEAEFAAELLNEVEKSKLTEAINTFGNQLGLSNEACYKIINEHPEYKDNILLMFYGQNNKGLVQVRKAFNENALVYAISNAFSYGETTKFIDEYRSVIPFSLSKYDECNKTKLGQWLFNHPSGTMSELENQILNFYNNSLSQETGKKSSGGNVSSKNYSGVTGNFSETASAVNNSAYPYIDMEGNTWAKDSVLSLTKKGVISGDGTGNFHPDNNVTREEFVKMMIYALNLNNKNSKSTFNDLPVSHWAYSSVSSAVENGIVLGKGNIFGTGENITRQDMAVICYKAIARLKELEAAKPAFLDKDEIDDYAKEAVGSIQNIGIINGFEDNRFYAKSSATRAQAAVIIDKVMKVIEL